MLGVALPRPLPEGLPVVDGQFPPLPGCDDEGRPDPPLLPLPRLPLELLLISITLLNVDHIGLSDVKNDDYKSSDNQVGAREIKFYIGK